MQEFRNQLLEIAKIKNENYTNVEVKIDHDGVLTFNAYINGDGWHRAYTMEECLAYFREKATNPVIKNIDVEVEMPEITEEIKASVLVLTPIDDLPF